MKTAMDRPPETLDERERAFCAKIRELDWFRTRVLEDEEGPGFSYTTGFWLNAGFPEIVVFALKNNLEHDILWDIYRDLKNGTRIPIGVPVSSVLQNLPVYFLPVGKQYHAEYLGWSRWFYCGDEFPCLQLIWPDRAGVFPWQPGFDEAYFEDQPDISPEGWLRALAH